ncbi:MAG TPA: dTMP kinase [Woeseiaceae bacterium]|nr:dTMP kinase [Woeseiaceae bacterium]
MTARGRFLTVEGGEGVGKSTNIEFLCSLIRDHGFEVQMTREPGGTPTAERIRDLLLEHFDEPMPDLAELLLFFAARTLHVENVIRPALARGTWIVCDRFTDATRAYQGTGRGLDARLIEQLAAWVHGDLSPDLTLLLDAPPEVGRGRAERRGDADRLEGEQAAFHARVREGYLALANREPGRFRVIDAGKPLDQVQADIEKALRHLWDPAAESRFAADATTPRK